MICCPTADVEAMDRIGLRRLACGVAQFVLQLARKGDIMPVIPATVLKRLYVNGSLQVKEDGFVFDLKNLIAPATITSIESLELDGEHVDGSQVAVVLPSGSSRPIGQISSGSPLHFPVGVVVTVHVSDETLTLGQHSLNVRLEVKEIGSLDIPVSDTIT
jgi:hypothetical protein